MNRIRRLVCLVICFVLMSSMQAIAGPKPDSSDLFSFKVVLPSGEKYGFISRATGKWAISPRFDKATFFSKETGLAGIKVEGKYGFINGEGKVVIPPQFDEVGMWSEGLCLVKIAGNSGFIDKTGKMIISPQPYDSSFFSEGLALTWVDHKAGFIDKTGKIVIATKYPFFVGQFHDGLAGVRLGRSMGFIDKTGAVAIEPRFENWDCNFSEGMAAVQIGGKYGFIDTTGRVVIEPRYDFAGAFHEGLAGVMLDGKIGFIDKTGKVVIDLKYEYPEGWQPQIAFVSGYSFRLGIAYVRWNGKYGCIDKVGNWVVQPVFDALPLYYLAEQRMVINNGYYYDVYGNKLDLYVNHMSDGYGYLKNKDTERAAASFKAALRLIPGDEAAKYGISLAYDLKQ